MTILHSAKVGLHPASSDLHKALQAANNFVASTLSTVYFDAVKDILYSDKIDSPRRLAVVSTLQEVSLGLVASLTSRFCDDC